MSHIRKITLQFPSLRAFLAEYEERISADGMLVRSEVPPAAGTRVDIEVVVAEGMRLLRARGQTLWSGTTGPGSRQKAAAVRFEELDEASRTLIGKIVDQQRRAGSETFSLEDVAGPSEARLLGLAVPAAVGSVEPAAPAGAPADSVFDLAAPPANTESDLFSSADAAAPATAADAGQPPSGGGPAPPVPLLADPDPAPFDLVEDLTGDDRDPDAAGVGPDPAPEGEGEPEPAPASDLSDLFGGDEPEMAPPHGRTEAFPPSFVDEVEAELEAAETTEDSFLVVDTSELEIQLGAPMEEPAPAPPAAVELESEPTPGPEVGSGSDATAATEIADETEVTAEAAAEIDSAAASEASLQVAQGQDAGRGPETVELPIVAPPPAPPPVVEQPAAAPPSPPAVEAPAQISEPGAVEPAPPATEKAPPAVARPLAAAALDDNLLSIPELDLASVSAEASSSPEGLSDLPSSAQSLRGAASSSRHLGTWLLIALLVGALAVAGYFLLGLVRGDGEPADPDARASVVPEPPAAVAEATPDRAAAQSTAAAPSGETDTPPAGDDAAPAAAEIPASTEPGPAEPAAAEPAPAEPAPVALATPLTGLDRITWSGDGAATVLVLAGDGAIARDRVELIPIAGGPPRLVIKISGVERPFQPAVLEVGTAQVQRIRTGLHTGGELHVVVDLAAPGVSVDDLAIRGSRVEVRLGAG